MKKNNRPKSTFDKNKSFKKDDNRNTTHSHSNNQYKPFKKDDEQTPSHSKNRFKSSFDKNKPFKKDDEQNNAPSHSKNRFKGKQKKFSDRKSNFDYDEKQNNAPSHSNNRHKPFKKDDDRKHAPSHSKNRFKSSYDENKPFKKDGDRNTRPSHSKKIFEGKQKKDRKPAFDYNEKQNKPKKNKEEISNPNVLFSKGNLMTKNFTPGYAVYSEKLIKKGKDEYRTWDEKKSKLAAAVKKDISYWDIPLNSKILYLGIGDGTTASHISDLIGEYGLIYGVEFALKPVQNLLCVVKMHKRNNIVPIYDNAKLPGSFANITSKVDIIYQDVAQRDQIAIIIRNAKLFLKKDGKIMLALKSRSIDSTKAPRQIYQDALDELKKCFTILDWKVLDPFEKDHCFIIAQQKK